MNITTAINDEQLFLPFLGGKVDTWANWVTALQVLHGSKIKKKKAKKVVQACTGRTASQLPTEGFDTALFLIGRRSGKSRMAAIIGAYEAVLAGHEHKLSKGEVGVIPIISPSKSQSRIVHGYLRSIFQTPLLKNEVVNDYKSTIELRNGTRIEILAGDWRTIRGFTLLAAILDEACFFGYEGESKIKSDTELVRAIKPSLATVGGKLIAISSPYAKRGWCYQTHKKHFANDSSNVLVWNCPSRTMNPTLPQSVVDDALREDLAAAKSEYLGEFRDDVGAFLPREIIERLVVENRTYLRHQEKTNYFAFVDLSGGRSDDAGLAIAHKENNSIVVDLAKRWRSPCNPIEVVSMMAEEIKTYNIHHATGDNYAAEFVASAFRENGIKYQKSKLNKSQLYLELLPQLCSGNIELPDDDFLVSQLSNLERRTRSGGKDIIDHPSGGHDDLANAVAGVSYLASKRQRVVGAL